VLLVLVLLGEVSVERGMGHGVLGVGVGNLGDDGLDRVVLNN